MFELAPVQFRSVGKIVMHGALDNALRIYAWKMAPQIHDQPDRIVQRIFCRPAHDELLQIIIEVLLMKWRRIHRIKKLFQVL